MKNSKKIIIILIIFVLLTIGLTPETKSKEVTSLGVTNFRIISSQSNETILGWDEVENALGYEVLLKADGEYKSAGKIKNNSIKLINLDAGKTYYAKIIAYSSTTSGKESEEIKIKVGADNSETTLNQVINLKQTNINGNTVTFKYNKVNGIKDYELYLKTEDTEYVKSGKTKKDNIKIINLQQEKEYSLMVKPVGGTTTGEATFKIGKTNGSGEVKIISKADGFIKSKKDEESTKKNKVYLQALVDEVSKSGGGTIYIPEGEYYFSSEEKNKSGYENYVIKCKNNVTIEGAGTSTVLKPIGKPDNGLDMFYFNDYVDSKYVEPNFLVNADFKNFVIDGAEAVGKVYNSSGKGFMINLFKDCDWENVIVKNTDGTGFGMDCPINCTIKNCKAYRCGKGADPNSPSFGGASGFGIGTGYGNDERMIIENCYAENNKNYGIFFEHQNRFNGKDNNNPYGRYPAIKSGGFIVSNCQAKGNLYDFGGARAYDLTYKDCISLSKNEKYNKLGFYFEQLSIRINIEDCKVNQEFKDITPENADYYYIKWGLDNAITTGVDKAEFASDKVCTRMEAVTLIYRMMGRPFENIITYEQDKHYKQNEYKYEYTRFKDISYTDKSIDINAVKWADENEITKGTGNDEFSPKNECSRAEVVEMLYRLWKNEGGNPDSISHQNGFNDVKKGSWYEKAIDWADYFGITQRYRLK